MPEPTWGGEHLDLAHLIDGMAAEDCLRTTLARGFPTSPVADLHPTLRDAVGWPVTLLGGAPGGAPRAAPTRPPDRPGPEVRDISRLAASGGCGSPPGTSTRSRPGSPAWSGSQATAPTWCACRRPSSPTTRSRTLTSRRSATRSPHHGQGRWNGVAILSRVGIDDVTSGFDDNAEPSMPRPA